MVNPGVQENTEYPRHIPVLLNDFVSQLKPFSGVWIDGTFGDGGYSKMLLESDAKSVIAIDRDPSVYLCCIGVGKAISIKVFFH
ncbi:MAG: 16S rRNA (cytosine(1402)-N(4))-methyltransferase [Paracoccaceae bacterium]